MHVPDQHHSTRDDRQWEQGHPFSCLATRTDLVQSKCFPFFNCSRDGRGVEPFFAAAPQFRNQLHVPHEEQDEEQITFPDFELVPCEKCRNLNSEDALIPDLLFKLHCLVAHAEVDDRMAKKIYNMFSIE
jgi:hypothetical protein